MKNTEELRRETIAILKKTNPATSTASLTTSQLAAAVGVKPGTVRRGYCLDGHYLGLRPIKLPNTRLLWPIHEESVQ